MMYNVCNRHPLVCVSRLMVALQLYIIQQRVSLVCAKFRICSFIELNKKMVGEEHPNTLMSKRDLDSIYQKMEKCNKERWN